MGNLFLGIDISTLGCKFVCIDTDKSAIEFYETLNFDKDLPHYETKNGVVQSANPSLSESDPNMWLEALHILFQKMLKVHYPVDKIKALSVSGQQHGLVTLDAQGNVTRARSKLWNDYSTVEECDLLTAAVGGKQAMIAEIGNSQRAGYTAGKIYHLYRHEPEAARRTSTFFLVHNFINWYLTGGKEGGVRVMEPGDVSGMALRHPARTNWSEKVCVAISSDLMRKLPPVLPSDRMIGKISPQLALRYNFSDDCLIDAGSGDNMYGAIGTGNIKPGIVTISLGTSGTAYTVLDQPWVDEDGEIALFCDSTGKYLPLLCVSNMANGYEEVLKNFGLDHASFTEQIQLTLPGNEGRLLFPWYSGERTPDLPYAAPLYWGFALNDFSKEIICRAVLEGHVLNLYDGFRKMPVHPREIRLTGGLSKSEVWRQTIADVFEAETIPVLGEGAALGAAIHAAWIYFREKNPALDLQNLTDSFVQLDYSGRKIPQNTAVYKKTKAAFHEISLKVRKESAVNPFKLFAEMRNAGSTIF